MKKISSSFSWLSITTILTLVVILPIILIVIYSFNADVEVLNHIKDTLLAGYLKNTFALLILVSLLTLVFGVGSAFLVTFFDLKFINTIRFGLILPFAIPAYILGFIYSDIFGYFGYVHLFFISLGFPKFFNILNFYTVVIVLSLSFYPYIYLIVRASFLKNANTLVNPALNLGLNKIQALFKVVLPLSRVAIFGGLSLVMMETISDYGVVSYYGVDTLSTAIFTAWFGLNDSGSAAYISAIAMVVILSILFLEKFSQGRARYILESSSAPFEKIKVSGIKAFFAYTFLSIPILFGFLIPFVWIINYSIKYMKSIVDSDFLSALVNTTLSAFLATSFIIIIAVILAYTYRIIPCFYTKYITKFATLGYTMPGAVIAIGIIILFSDIDHFLIDNFGLNKLLFSGTLFALIFGFVVRYLAVGFNSISSAFEKVGVNINKASRNLGKSPFVTLFKVELPILKSSILITFILVFIDIVKELPLTLILRPFNYETLATKTYALAQNEMVQESAIYAFSIIVICFIPIIFSLKENK